MNIIRIVVLFIVYVLIRIGDFVILIFSSLRKSILYCLAQIKRAAKTLLKPLKFHKGSRTGTFIISSSKTKRKKKKKGQQIFIIKIFKNLGIFVFTLMRKALSALSGLLIIILKLFISIILFPWTVIKWYFERRTRKRLAREFAKKRAAQKALIKAKPSFFYKTKLIFFGFVFSFTFLFVPILGVVFVSELPNPSNLSVNFIPKTTKIYDRNGTLLYEIFANQNRTIVKLADIPKKLQQATIAIEDKDFYNHPGFDIRGIARALIANIRKQGFQGGSTITQQLIKSAFFSPEPNIQRKIKEIILAFWSEQLYSKDRILELYFNFVPYGGTAWGIESASEIYFGKHVSDLSLGESAFLAGLPRAPSVYSPYNGSGNLWKPRQKEVLDAMARQGYISDEDAKKAYDEVLEFRSPDVPIKAPHFVMYIRDLLIKKYGINEVERGGLQVKTTLDLPTQEKVEQIVATEVASDRYLNISNGASLVTNPSNGDILAMVGSKDYFDNEIDGNVNITTSLRQPGSTIKLITYTLALSTGFTEATILDDTPLTIYSQGEAPYVPVNYDGAFHGRIPLRTAFANSFNIPAVRTAQKLGVGSLVAFGQEMGISSWKDSNNYGVSITLGGGEVKMTDLATAYGVIANSGKRVDLDPILEVDDSYGAPLYKKERVERQIVDPGVAFIISDILADNKARSIEFGLNSPLAITESRVSVKTGTTDNKRDNWTVGFTPHVLVATWVGNNDNTPMSQSLASGITGAAPMWNKIITGLLNSSSQNTAFTIPQNIIKKFCLGQDRYFIKGSEKSVLCVLPSPTPTPSPTP